MLAWASSAMATPITDMSIPMLGASYNHLTGDFTISGVTPSLVVTYGDSTSTTYYGNFVLGTTGLHSKITNNGKTITYTKDSSNTGQVDLLDASDGYSALLLGDLQFLEMTIIDPAMGLFEGLGHFSVTGGSLWPDFGSSGGLATIGISFNMPLDFNSPFAAMANTRLYPKAAATPEPSTILLLGSGLLGLVGYNRKRFCKKS